ncbi:hypothetical protein PPYR_09099 [Photinus pyralis]|uniref:Mitochondrial import inner membrane translocase subunit n=1 Tax=Photinus pyralis TaxID=7054 RepID=A0A1Y1MFU0_PHOPY|nr:mitochondrial import inner membrane translocase subunit Tim10 B-like [Photinus pyralis]XP_031354247.1 mitochondrial import inner membrane translocase subunit Tim10 B-like [Photinus pyralis]KAB0793570.1 hypothetical protein PPYR_13190 [Photinus pyralis]KAB0798106.1 hypothetical protein PPYR_09099 [Photinus pyralis]
MEANIRTFKDFLQLYNLLSHTCFKRCIDNLNTRNLDDNEIKCVEDCAEKFIRLNHRFMAIYVEHQQVLVNRRMKEAEAAAAAAAVDSTNDASSTNALETSESEHLPQSSVAVG